jgi:hypothetical protein
MYLFIQKEIYKGRNAYHRSRMFEYELLSNFSKIFPIGTPTDAFLNSLKIDHGALKEIKAMPGTYHLYFRPSLRIPLHEQRDYLGFHAAFKDNKLISLGPSGPQPPEIEIDMSELPINEKFAYYQGL